jgi:hypothetical protein
VPLFAPALICAALLGSPAAPAAAASKQAARASHRGQPRTGRMAVPIAELVRAVRRNDRAAIERLASRLGVARLGEALASPDDAVARAALVAIPLARGRALLAGAVADKLAAEAVRQNEALVVAAARALGELLDGAAPYELEEWEVPPDLVGHACGILRALATRADAPPPARLAALDALATAAPVCSSTAELAPLLHDPVPSVRRAAALIVRPGDRQAAAALRDVLRDSDPTVASAAVAAVCRADSTARAARAKGDPLVQQSVEAARRLAPAATTPPEDAVEMLACVAAAGTPADRSLLDELRRGPASPLRDRAAALAEGGAPAVRPE